MHIHQAGDEILAGKVADLGSLGGEVLADLGDLVTVDQDVDDTVKLDGRIETWAFLRSKAIIGTSKQQIQDSHTHADTGVDLLQDDGALRVVGHIGVELNAAVDGARVADNRIGLHELLAVLGQTEELVVLTNRGERCALEALLLHAQHVDDVQLGQDGIEVARHMVATQNLGAGGSSVPGATA